MKKFVILAAIAAMFALCNDVCGDLISASDSNRVNAVASTQMYTRATTATDSDLRSKGFYLTGVADGTAVFAGNYTYSKAEKMYTGPGYWANGTMQFYASYPASLKWDGGTIQSISVADDPLIATAETSKVTAIDLQFHHIASRIGGNIISNLSCPSGDVAVENVKVSYTNVYTTGDYDGNAWSNPSTPAADVTLSSPQFAVYTNVVALAQDAKITFDFDVTGAVTAHRNYTYAIKELAQGYVYQYELTLNEQFEADSVKVSKTVAVDDWNTQKEEINDNPEPTDPEPTDPEPTDPEPQTANVMDIMGLMHEADYDEANAQQCEYASLAEMFDLGNAIHQSYVAAYAKAMVIMAKHDGYLQSHFQANVKSKLESIGVSSDVVTTVGNVWTTGWETISDKDAATVTAVANELKTAWQAFIDSFTIKGEDATIETT